MVPSTVVRPPDAALRSAVRLALWFAAAKLLLHVVGTLWQQHIGVGYFRDEFYYLMCGRHLAWGYVDHGPIVALQARITETVFGHSLLGIRFLSAAAGAARVFLVGMLCWSLGGKRAAQSLAMMASITVPIYLGIDGILSMNSFESIFWMTCLLATILLLRDESDGHNKNEGRDKSEITARRWMWWTIFGVSAGIGLLNKPSMVFFLFALAAGLLLTPQRKVLFTRQAAYGIALLIVLALPNVLWQMSHHWPTLEFLNNGRVQGKNVRLNPLAWILNQLAVMGPWTAFVWVPGLVYLLKRPQRRWLGLMWLVLIALMIALGAKDYYFAPVYPILFAAGGIAWTNRFASNRSVAEDHVIAFPLTWATFIALFALVLPASMPVLAPMTFVTYKKTLHLVQNESENTGKVSVLPQFFADRYGWSENLAEVTRIVQSLSPEERAHAGIFCGNYGQAASLEWLGHDLPPVIAKHNNYWLWGPRGVQGDVMIIDSSISIDELRQNYSDVRVAGHVGNPLSMWYERHDIYLARHRRIPIPAEWPEDKFYY